MQYVYFKISLLSALVSTIWNNINDCDETFNYLEPLNFISSTDNHTSFQTWEYAPEFGLRSYFYLWIFGWPSLISRSLGLPGWLSFLAVRLNLAMLSAISSTILAKSASRYLYPEDKLKKAYFGMTFCFIHLLAPGYFISSSSSVPSAFSTTMTSLMLATWIDGQLFFSVGTVAFSGLVLWPFSASLGIPLALYCIYNKNTAHLLKSSIFWALLLIFPMVSVDSYYYGKFTFPNWNIIVYNAISALLNKSSSQLYGTEPCIYYLKNYFLNFNIAFVIVLGLAPAIFSFALFKRLRGQNNDYYSKVLKMFTMTLSPFYIWNIVFFIQSHKEERFLFPCFSCLSLTAALTLSTLFINCSKKLKFWSKVCNCLLLLFLAVFGILSVMRIMALSTGYSAPMFLTQHLPAQHNKSAVLCIGRDWHHFPSHFLLPQGEWKVHFLKSDFGGQLPGKFAENVGVIAATRTPVDKFNDKNLPEADRFYDVDLCNFIIDRDSTPGKHEVQYSADTKKWKLLVERSILERSDQAKNNESSNFFEKVFEAFKRSFFIPVIFQKNNTWVSMHILRKI